MASQRSARITRKSKQKIFYADFSIDFDLNPITGDLELFTNADAVKQSIINLVMTQLGERFYELDVGSTVPQSFFNPIDDITQLSISESILDCIKKHERRISNINVLIRPDIVNNVYYADIFFTIINIPDTQSFSLPLFRVR